MAHRNFNVGTTFVISDLHFYHNGVFRFDPKCAKLFGDLEGRVRKMTEWWNEIVSPTDTVIMLGDICFRANKISCISKLNGVKYLIRGNHDEYSERRYLEEGGIHRILPQLRVNDLLFSHYPVHPQQFARYRGNVHGHLHEELIDDPRYYNVCVEHTNYRPLPLGVVLNYFDKLSKE